MYTSHWGLRESPFRSSADSKYFFRSPTHDEALARLHFLVDNHRQLGVVTGEPGCGKSILLRVFAEQLRQDGANVVLVGLLGLTASEFLWNVAEQLGATPSDRDVVLWRRIVDRLVEQRYQRLSSVVLLDEADEAHPDVLSYVLRLLRADTSPDARLTAVLTATPQGLDRIGRRLLDLSDLRIDLEPWDQGDVADYLQASLTKAGCSQTVFDTLAATQIHALTHGIPRQVNQLAELALLAGAGQRRFTIDPDTVRSVHAELQVGPLLASPARTAPARG